MKNGKRKRKRESSGPMKMWRYQSLISKHPPADEDMEPHDPYAGESVQGEFFPGAVVWFICRPPRAPLSWAPGLDRIAVRTGRPKAR